MATTSKPNPFSQSAIDGANRYLSRYVTFKNPNTKQKTTYQNIANTYGKNSIQNNKISANNLRGYAERAYRTANPMSAYTKSADNRFINSISHSIDNNTGVNQEQLGTYYNLLKKWNMQDPSSNNMAVDLKNKVNSIYDAQQKSQLDALKASQDKATGDLNQQKADLAPQYQQERGQADVVNAQNVQKLRELMSNNGLNASGENVTAQTSLNNQRQNSLNQLNLQEQQSVNDINKQIANVNDPSQKQAIINQISAQRSQALLDAQNRANDIGYQRQQDALHNALSIAGLTGTYNGKPTMAAQQQAADNAWRKYTYNNMSAAEKAQFNQNSKQFGENMAWQYWAQNSQNAASLAASNAEIQAYKNMGFNINSKGSGAVPQSFQSDMSNAVKKGVPASWAPIMTEIAGRESSYNPGAKNKKSSAYGYGQLLAANQQYYGKGLNYNNGADQLVAMYRYIKARYGTPQKALAYWNSHGNY